MKKLIFLFIGIMVLGILSYKVTFALFSDQATSTGNTFTAAEFFPSISPSPTP